MKIELPINQAAADACLPNRKPDGSGVGINYVDAVLKPLKATLADGRKLAFKRRGLKITITIGNETGEGLMRRLQHGPDEKAMLREALQEAARSMGAEVAFEDGGLSLKLPDAPA